MSTGASGRGLRQSGRAAWLTLIARLHFYVGLFVGPFIFVAALTGTIFVLTPQIEDHLYSEQLFADTVGEAQPLARQIEVARAVVGEEPGLFAVRPASEAGRTTRVMFSEPGHGPSESRAIFVDPVSLAIRGDLMVYGTSSILPFRTTLDYLHRNLLLGEFGRAYSELAASWLWLLALGGLTIWLTAGVRNRADIAARSRRLRLRRRHGLIGLWVVLALVFFSATGLTWSKWAGDRIGVLRQQLGWVTPSVSTALQPGLEVQAAPGHEGHEGHGEHAAHADHEGHEGHGEHADHMAAMSGMAAATATDALPSSRIDAVLAVARQGGIDSSMLEIRPPRAEGYAWLVSEVDRSWPTQVDAVAVDPDTLSITSRADFASFPLVAKLIRWGIDAHMGILFGVANQLLVAAFGLAACTMLVLGYMMWWQRRPAPGAPVHTLTAAWNNLPVLGRCLAVVVAVALGWSLPVMGLSLLAFVLVDVVRWRLTRHCHV